MDDYKNDLPLVKSLRANLEVADPPIVRETGNKQLDRQLVIILTVIGMLIAGVVFVCCILTRSSNFQSVDLRVHPGDVDLDPPLCQGAFNNCLRPERMYFYEPDFDSTEDSYNY